MRGPVKDNLFIFLRTEGANRVGRDEFKAGFMQISNGILHCTGSYGRLIFVIHVGDLNYKTRRDGKGIVNIEMKFSNLHYVSSTEPILQFSSFLMLQTSNPK